MALAVEETELHIKSQKDFYSGLLYIVVGLAFAWGATQYSMGTGARMGPGYFPRLLGLMLAGLGALVVLQAMRIKPVDAKDVERIGAWSWRPLVFIIASNLAFGVMLGGLPSIGIPSMGLIVGIFVLTFIAALAGDEFKFKEVLILSIVLATTSYLAFIVLLQLQFPVWPAFISR